MNKTFHTSPESSLVIDSAFTFSNGETKKTFLDQVDTLARLFVCGGLFFLPVSSSLGQLIMAGSILAAFGRQFRIHSRWLWTYKMSYFAVALALFFIAGAFYNPFDFKPALHQAFKYAEKLVLLLFILPLFADQRWRRNLLNILLVTALVFTTCLYLQKFSIILFDQLFQKTTNKLLSPIPWTLWVSFSIFMLVNRTLDESKYRIFYGIALFYLLFFMFFINIERTGMLVTLVLLLLIPIQRFGKRGFLMALVILPIGGGLAYQFSPTVHHRFKEAFLEARIFNEYKIVIFSSVGIRLSFLYESARLIKERPLLGYGTGVFRHVYKPPYMPKFVYEDLKKEVLRDPHNVYAHITLQIGILGLLVFLGWLLTHFLESRALPLMEKRLVQGLILTFMIGSNFEDGLLRTRICTFYVTILLVLLAAKIFHQTSLSSPKEPS